MPDLTGEDLLIACPKGPNGCAVSKLLYRRLLAVSLIRCSRILRVRESSDNGMKRLITIAGLVLGFACQPFASDRMALARVTVYWPGEGSGKFAAWNGARLGEDHCAVDPKKIPFGSKVIFDGGECIAVDTGSDVVKRKAARSLGRTSLSGTRSSSTGFSTPGKGHLPGKMRIHIS
jgi:hypothetical protein